jgi:glycine cleavage system H lipoate-binding protein
VVVLLVLFAIISFLTIDYLVQRAERRKAGGVAAEDGASPPAGPRSLRRRSPRRLADEVPGGVFVSPGHVWVSLESSGSLKLGVDRLLLGLLGGLDCVYVLPEGAEVKRGGPLMMLRCGQRALKVRSPVDGIVSKVNQQVRRNPGRVPADPFDKGWIYGVSPVRLSQALGGMVVAERATEWMGRELDRMRDLLVAGSSSGGFAPVTLADGGMLADDFASILRNDEWQELVGKFFGEEHADTPQVATGGM